MSTLGRPRLVVVGAYVADCLIKSMCLPAWGRTDEATSIRTSPGGKALNLSVALARLGAEVSAVGVVGDDPLGQNVLKTLAEEGVSAGGIEVRSNVPTPICVCFSGEQGQTSFIWYIADEAVVSPEVVAAAQPIIRHADALIVTFEVPVPTVRATMEIAHQEAAQLVVQPAPVLAETGQASMLPWDKVDVLVPNEAEAMALLSGNGSCLRGEDLAAAVARKLDICTVVVTHGAAGCVLHHDGRSKHFAACEAETVDTTGASDAFAAAFSAWMLVGGQRPEEAVQKALAAAAVTVSRPGSYESMPSADDLDWRHP